MTLPKWLAFVIAFVIATAILTVVVWAAVWAWTKISDPRKVSDRQKHGPISRITAIAMLLMIVAGLAHVGGFTTVSGVAGLSSAGLLAVSTTGLVGLVPRLKQGMMVNAHAPPRPILRWVLVPTGLLFAALSWGPGSIATIGSGLRRLCWLC
ncbi:MAG TPA: hypothetical protein PK264_12930 [Hyphomicrobiaceae bacterium]|nr:hypothetical protein [Hyphomicrobiaceae bacterium]